ncbi:MAG TPA: class I SAM-dependent methyltransferase [Terriglobia bacterium]
MDTILESLGPGHLVLDLGCGKGSFQYASYKCKILGIDLALDGSAPSVAPDRIFYACGDSHALPLSSSTIDFAVCNHSLEHVAHIGETLSELARVLKPRGFLWISVPDGFGFDDGLYRFLYNGGGHINRFSFAGLKNAVESTGLQLVQSNTLTSSFIYCKRPEDAAWPYLSRRSKLLHIVGILRPVASVLNEATRFLDRRFHSRLSRYGWGFLFARGAPAERFALPSYFNVCAGCGSGHAIQTLRPGAYKRWTIPFYRCPRCNEANLMFDPPAGFD